METITDFLNTQIITSEKINFSIKTLLLVIFVYVFLSFSLNYTRKILTKRLSKEDRMRFFSFYEYIKYFIYLIVLLIILSTVGVKLTALLASTAALMLGVGLALQTFFQDIISGIFILSRSIRACQRHY